MQGHTRERFSQSSSFVTNSKYYYGINHDGVTGETYNEYIQEYNPRNNVCRDIVGNRRNNNDLYISKRSQKPAYAHIQVVTNDGTFEDFPDEMLTGHHDYQYFDTNSRRYYDPSEESDEAIFTQLCAETNPSKADFDAAVFIGELRDVPGLLHSVGENIIKYGANEYLKFQYGWKPLIGDLRRMIHAYDYLAKRLKAAERLATNAKIKRRSRDITHQYGGIEVTSPNDYYLYNRDDWRKIVRYWAVVEWVPDNPENILSDLLPLTHDLTPLQRTKQAMYGGVIDGSTLWQLMPWSWLLDWGSNASNYLAAKRNVVGAKVGINSCLMKRTAYQQTSELLYGPQEFGSPVIEHSVSGAAGTEYQITSERFVGMQPSIVTADAFNLIGKSAFKQSILGALGVQRLRRLPF